ncbi:MAG: beta-galactosidase [Deltaproteobacteria bacterium]|nr:beta-galactosidase [Deltaproteobacteria bacterium]
MRSRLRASYLREVLFPKHIPFGALHHATFRKQSPPLDGQAFADFMRREIGHMKECGLDSVSFNCTWSDIEVAPGEYDFSAPDTVRQVCDDLSMDHFVWLWPELTPPWFVKKHPEALAVAASGYVTRSASPAHPIFRAYAQRFLDAAVSRYRRHPHNLGYNISIEGGLWWNQKPDTTNQDDRLWDYNEAANDGFRAWLRGKYKFIAELNRMWRAHFRSFDEVQPPRARYHRDPAMLHNQVEWLDHRLYMCDLYTDWMRFKIEVVRALDDTTPIVDHTHQVDPAFWSQDLWAIAPLVDALGVSMFTSDVAGDYMSTNWLMDRHRSAAAGKPLWLWELRAGQTTWGITNWGVPLDADDIERFTWQVLGNGATCVQYWNWRPHMGGVEVGGHGLSDRAGRPTARAKRVGAVAASVAEGPLARCKPVAARIAIVDNVRARIVAAGEGSDAEVVNAQRDFYAAWRSQGFAVDFVSEAAAAAGALTKYQVACVPFGYAMADNVAAALKRYVNDGGHLVAGLFLAMKDENGFGEPIVPGLGLHHVFGCEESLVRPCFSEHDASTSTLGSAYQVQMTGRPALRVTNALHPNAQLVPGQKLHGHKFEEVLSPQSTATVIAQNASDEAVVVANRFGKGRTLYFGSLPGRLSDFADDGFARLLCDFATLAQVQPVVVVQQRGDRAIDTRLLRGQDESVLVVINCESTAVAVNVALAGLSFTAAVDHSSGNALPVEGNTVFVELGARTARAFILSTPAETK